MIEANFHITFDGEENDIRKALGIIEKYAGTELEYQGDSYEIEYFHHYYIEEVKELCNKLCDELPKLQFSVRFHAEHNVEDVSLILEANYDGTQLSYPKDTGWYYVVEWDMEEESFEDLMEHYPGLEGCRKEDLINTYKDNRFFEYRNSQWELNIYNINDEPLCITAKTLQRANDGCLQAQKDLYSAYLNGNGGVQYDLIEAIKWLKKAAFQGDAEAAWRLGEYYESGWRDSIEKDIEQAIFWTGKAAEKDTESFYKLGLLYLYTKNGHFIDSQQAKECLDKYYAEYPDTDLIIFTDYWESIIKYERVIDRLLARYDIEYILEDIVSAIQNDSEEEWNKRVECYF